jgi:uncharacterized protein
MRIHELTTAECTEVLQRTTLGRLACVRDDAPYILPLHLYYDGDHLYGFATLGKKIDWLRENPVVCVEVDEVTDEDNWTSVLVFGRYEELPPRPEYEEPRKRAQSLFQQRPRWWQPATAKLASGERAIPVVYRIQIQEISGRRAARERVGGRFEPPPHVG